ncbi:hypothetical protein IX27_19565 [Streptomyces sp. JS01]|nr:hypothetical protein IX27_19565 [Streptomyces sp. JS01]
MRCDLDAPLTGGPDRADQRLGHVGWRAPFVGVDTRTEFAAHTSEEKLLSWPRPLEVHRHGRRGELHDQVLAEPLQIFLGDGRVTFSQEPENVSRLAPAMRWQLDPPPESLCVEPQESGVHARQKRRVRRARGHHNRAQYGIVRWCVPHHDAQPDCTSRGPRAVAVGDGSCHEAIQPQPTAVRSERIVSEGMIVVVRVLELGPLTTSVRLDDSEIVETVVRYQFLVNVHGDDPAQQQVHHTTCF